jgi:hypothetical protein
MKKMVKGLLLVLSLALSVWFLSACTSTGKGTAPVAEGAIGPLFENQSPAFSINYPSNWKKGKKGENDFLFLKTGAYGLPNMRVSKSSSFTSSTTPEQAAESAVETFITKFKAKKCKVLYTKAITLADGTPAVETEIKWNHPSTVLYTCNIQAEKGGVAITAGCTDMMKVSEKNKAYLRTLLIK